MSGPAFVPTILSYPAFPPNLPCEHAGSWEGPFLNGRPEGVPSGPMGRTGKRMRGSSAASTAPSKSSPKRWIVENNHGMPLCREKRAPSRRRALSHRNSRHESANFDGSWFNEPLTRRRSSGANGWTEMAAGAVRGVSPQRASCRPSPSRLFERRQRGANVNACPPLLSTNQSGR
jgi:hypothetical protein